MPAATDAVARFERGWEGRLGVPVRALASARGAIAAALSASGIGPGDDVVVTGYTCVAVPAAVRSVGARPVYADVDRGTGNVTVGSVAAAMTPTSRAVIVQHFLGNPAPTGAIRASLGPDVVIVDDAAHALGSTHRGRPVGLDGDWTVLSTEQSKSLSTGQGGLLAAVSARALEAWTRVRPTSVTPTGHTRRWAARVGVERLAFAFTPGGWRFPAAVAVRTGHRVGLARISSRDPLEAVGGMPAWRGAPMPAALAEIGNRQLSRIQRILDHRARIADRYERSLAGRIGLLEVDGSADVRWLRFPVVVPDGDAAERSMRDLGWELGPRWFSGPIHPGDVPPDSVGYRPGTCPVAEWLGARIINLPTHPLVSDRLAERLAGDLLRAVGRAA